jgi:hypothetical protein
MMYAMEMLHDYPMVRHLKASELMMRMIVPYNDIQILRHVLRYMSDLDRWLLLMLVALLMVMAM